MIHSENYLNKLNCAILCQIIGGGSGPGPAPPPGTALESDENQSFSNLTFPELGLSAYCLSQAYIYRSNSCHLVVKLQGDTGIYAVQVLALFGNALLIQS